MSCTGCWVSWAGQQAWARLRSCSRVGGPRTVRDWAVGEGLIIIDEFPYLMKASPSLPSLIQRARPAGLRAAVHCAAPVVRVGDVGHGPAARRQRAAAP